MRRNNISKNRVSRSVYPTTEIQRFLFLKLLQVQDNRIIAKRARVSSGPVPLYDNIMKHRYINFSVEKRGKH